MENLHNFKHLKALRFEHYQFNNEKHLTINFFPSFSQILAIIFVVICCQNLSANIRDQTVSIICDAKW